jgi:hypothetical protein
MPSMSAYRMFRGQGGEPVAYVAARSALRALDRAVKRGVNPTAVPAPNIHHSLCGSGAGASTAR